MHRNLLIILIFFLFVSSIANAQDVVVPLLDNHVQREAAPIWKNQYKPVQLMKSSHGEDTIKLPFFDDFWYAGRKLDSAGYFYFRKSWQSGNVFINTTMASLPPTVGVATFDGLNSAGLAYHQGGGRGIEGRADTLTSNKINLAGYTNDTNVYLSFFYQPQGLGDDPNEKDSLVVEFKLNDSTWISQWSAKGTTLRPFRQAIIPVRDNYLYDNFQFRFVGHASLTGNLDQWHVDYVYMDKGRNPADTVFRDVAFVYPPHTILKDYYAMPARQFRRGNIPGKLRGDMFALVKNLYNQDQNLGFRYHITRENGTTFAPANPTQTVQNNISAFGNDTLKLRLTGEANLSGLTDNPFNLKIKYSLITPNQVTAQPENDTAEHFQKFSNYLAYDDGTAEAGYGLEPTVKLGEVALRFKLETTDTLYGVAIHFNQAETDNRFMTFSLLVWEYLTPGPARATNDRIVARLDDLIPHHGYGYHYFRLQNPVVLNSGNFFVGWGQNREFVLNVGFDRNYNLIEPGPNPNLFVNTLGRWENSVHVGAPMIRPVFGNQPYVGIKEERAPASSALKSFNPVLYPNPSNGSIRLVLQEEETVNLSLYDMTGKLLDQQQQKGKNISLTYQGIPKGMYFLRIIAGNGKNVSTQKIVIE